MYMLVATYGFDDKFIAEGIGEHFNVNLYDKIFFAIFTLSIIINFITEYTPPGE